MEEKNPTLACDLMQCLFDDREVADPGIAQGNMLRFGVTMCNVVNLDP